MDEKLQDCVGRDWMAEANLYWRCWLKSIKMNRILRFQNRMLRKALFSLLAKGDKRK